MELVVQAFTKKYFEFSGRARRKEYWLFTLFYSVLYFITLILDVSFDLFNEEFGVGTFGLILMVGLSIPFLAVAVRRLHDKDKSGWFLLLSLIPIIGTIILLVWFCTKGTDGSNRFGDDPLSGLAA